MLCKPITAVALLSLALIACSPMKTKPSPPHSPWVTSALAPHQTIHRFFQPRHEGAWKRVHPGLREKVEAIQVVMAAEGYDLRPLEGFRSPERQDMLLSLGSGVTKAGAWSSCHNYGLAVDATIYVDGLPSWDLDNPHVLAGLLRFGELAEVLGLNWGGRWKAPVDYPHVEMKADCAAAKWTRRAGGKAPAFVASLGEPSRQTLARYLAPAWCPAGAQWACNGAAQRWAWDFSTPLINRASCAAINPNNRLYSSPSA